MLQLKLTMLMAVLALSLASGCAQYSDKRGVEVSWDSDTLSSFSAGSTTRQDVLTKLGPPSQVISLGDESVLYYLFERAEGEAMILIVYNTFDVDTRYDRAVFFFDENDILTEYASRTPANAP
jgi:outer membrane protein assembly factor BamE (lipoprotein component of BamABCDE complex)